MTVRRLVAALVLPLLSAAAIAGFAQGAGTPGNPAVIRIDRAEMQRSASGDEVTFTVTIGEPGDYEVVVEFGGRFSLDHVMNLRMEPDTGAAPQQIGFSFADQRCG